MILENLWCYACKRLEFTFSKFYLLLSTQEIQKKRIIVESLTCTLCKKEGVTFTHFSNSTKRRKDRQTDRQTDRETDICTELCNLGKTSSDQISHKLLQVYKMMCAFNISNFEILDYIIKESESSIENVIKIEHQSKKKDFKFTLTEKKMSFKKFAAREILKSIIKLFNVFQNHKDLKSEVTPHIKNLKRLLHSLNHQFCQNGQCTSIFESKTADFIYSMIKVLNVSLDEKLPGTECFLKRKSFSNANCETCNNTFESFDTFVIHSQICLVENHSYIDLINMLQYKCTLGFNYNLYFVNSVEKVIFNQNDILRSENVKSHLLYMKYFIQQMPDDISLEKKRKNENLSSVSNKKFAISK